MKNHSFQIGANAMRSPGRPLRQGDEAGVPAAGRIVKLLIGQGYGYIRLADEREVYFHRADLEDGTSFNDLRMGDAVRFRLLDDQVSGARALHLKRLRSTR